MGKIKSEMKLDILCFGAHADDVEIGMAGTIYKYAKRGYKIGICDLTRAELSSNGTVEIREEEAQCAANLLGVQTRVNLEMPDRGLYLDHEKICKVVDVIRQFQPTVVFAPFEIDRHPDHGNCTAIIKEAFFSAGIRRFQGSTDLEPYRPNGLYYYMINGFHHPDFVIDISDEIEKKVESLKAYESQFVKTSGSVDTPLTNGYIDTVKSREKMFGKEVGTAFAEGFKTSKPLLLNQDLLDWS